MHLRFIESSDATTSRPQQEQAPAPQTCVSRETAAPHFIAPPLAPQATEAAPRTARTTAQVQVRTRYHPRIVSRETFGTCAYRRAHPQTRNHASTAHQRPPTTSGVPPLGSTPLNHSRTPTPRAFPQSRTRAATYAPHPQRPTPTRAAPAAIYRRKAPRHPPQTSLTPASRAASARGPRASARRPMRVRSTR